MQTPRRQTSNLAVASLSLGILGWILLPVVGGIAAVVTGHMARSEIRSAPDRIEGQGLALSGLVLGWASLAVGIAGALFLFWMMGAVDFLRWLSGLR
jgi:hypothetical protein